MIKGRAARGAAGRATILLSAFFLLCAGCGFKRAGVEFTSYRDVYFPETFKPKFGECVYRHAPDGDLHIVARVREDDSSRAAYEPPPSTQPAAVLIEEEPITQWLHVHLFWRPYPGRTFDDSSALNAMLRYVVVAPTGTAVYEGVGFAFPQKKRWSSGLTCTLEQCTLKLTHRTGTVPDVLGDARVNGLLSAKRDDARTLELTREIERRARETGQ